MTNVNIKQLAIEKFSLKEHAEWKHHGVSFACDQCGYKVSQIGKLKRHFESTHDEGNIFENMI